MKSLAGIYSNSSVEICSDSLVPGVFLFLRLISSSLLMSIDHSENSK